MTRQAWLWLAVAALGGAGMALQSRVNGELGMQLQHGTLAAFISFGCGLVLLGVVAVFSPPMRRGLRRLIAVLRSGELPWWFVLTGFVGAFYVAAQGLVAGITGIALFTVSVVAGQTISSLVVDRIGVGGLASKPITVPRVAGAFIALVAVTIAVAGQGVSASWLLAVPLVAGLLQSLQQAMSGVVQRRSGSALAQATSNFTLGFVTLGVAVLVQALTGTQPAPLPSNPLLYTGGALGVAFIATASVAVHHLGVLTLGLATICGQVLTSLIVDTVAPVAGGEVTRIEIASAALTIVAVAVTTLWRRRGRAT